MAESFTCEACGGAFSAKRDLDTHTKKEHPQPSPTAAAADEKKRM